LNAHSQATLELHSQPVGFLASAELKSTEDFLPEKTDKNFDLHQGRNFRGALNFGK
jgi:hypothetical protein